MLCDRPVNMLDYYVDIEPDRDYDIYSMADDMDVCRQPPRRSDGPSTALSDPRNARRLPVEWKEWCPQLIPFSLQNASSAPSMPRASSSPL